MADAFSNATTGSSAARSRRFSLDVAGTLIVRLVMTAGSVLAGVIVARWLGADGLGTLAVINVTIATVVQMGAVGLPSAATYFISRDRRQLRPVAARALSIAFLFGALLAGGVALLAWTKPQLFNDLPYDLIRIAIIAIPFQLLTLISLNIFLAAGHVARFNLWDLLIQSFIPINAIVVLVVLRGGLRPLVVLNTAIQVGGALAVVFVLMRIMRSQPASDVRKSDGLLASLLRYGLKFHVSLLASAIIFRADLLILNHYRGTAEAGVYSVASQVALLLMLLPSVISTLLFPRVTAEQDTDGNTTCVVARHSAFIMLVICLAAAVLSFLLPWLYGPGFTEAPLLLLILLPGVFVIGVESVLVQHFNALGLPGAVALLWVVTLVINLPLVVVLVQNFGARGAAMASTISYLMIFMMMLIYFAASTGKPLREILLINGAELRGMFQSFQRAHQL